MRLPFLRKAPADPRVVEAEQAYREAVAVGTRQLKEAHLPVVAKNAKQKLATPLSLP